MKRSRRQRLVQLNRQQLILERRYGRALLRLMRKVGRESGTELSMTSAISRINDHRPQLISIIELWVRRVMFTVGPENIDHIMARVGRKSVEIKSAFDIFQEVAREWLTQYAIDQSTRIITGMIERGRQSLEQSRRDGIGERQATRALQRAIGGRLSDAQRIARTEMHTGATRASDQSARSTGLDMVKEWGATDDKRTRETHVEADGQRREMDEPFDVGEAKLRYPGDENGPAEEVINCRCVALYHPRINGEVFD